MSVPAVQRGRNLICSIATLPLVQHGPDNAIAPSSLLSDLDPDVGNVVTLAQTLEDLLFDGISWWLITAQDFAGFPIAVRHLDVGTVSLQPPAGGNVSPLPSGIDPRRSVVWVDGKPVPHDLVIRFDSPNPAVLKVGGRAIRRSILLDQTANMYAEDPRPLDYFTPSENLEPVDDEEVAKIMRQWKAARKERGTAYIPAWLDYNSVDSPSPQQLQLVELSRQASLDIANSLGIDPEDLGISTTSRTYSNDVDRRRNKLNEVLAPYMRAITDRLTKGDVTKRGYKVRFDTTEYLLPNPTERWSTYQTAKAMGALTIDEIREAEGMPPLPEDAQPEEVQPVTEPEQVEASRPATHNFDSNPLTFADVPLQTFSVDRDNRIIEGLALPYRSAAERGGIKFRFNQGALKWSDVPRVKLLRDHDYKQLLGKAIQLKDTPDGLLTRFKVARGPEGDRALELAEDGVLDGMSVGVDFDPSKDAAPDPKDKSVLVVHRADLREVSLTGQPAFDDARVTRVAASRTTGGPVPDTDTEPVTAPDTQPEDPVPAQTFTADQVAAMLAAARSEAPTPEPERQVVNPTRSLNLSITHEPVPYRFDRGGNFRLTDYDFATDLCEVGRSGDFYGTNTDAGKRVMGLMRETFEIQTGDVNELNPNIQRPDMFVDQQDYKYPIWNAIGRGSPPNGVQPFTFPKYSSSSGLVGDHVEGTEPTGGSYVTTSQTVTPTALSGKAHITRETWDMGGNPAVSTIVFNQMVRGYREGLESAAATFLNTLTAATDITITTAAVDTALQDAWTTAVVGLQFTRSYDFSTFVVEQGLFKAFAEAVDESGGTGKGRPLFPMINPANANGTAALRFRTMDLGGIVAIPTWSLTTTTGSPNNSWLFDPEYVLGWATPPQRLEFPGSTQAGAYAPVAFVDVAIWGYKAFANSDINGVRQVIYDPV